MPQSFLQSKKMHRKKKKKKRTKMSHYAPFDEMVPSSYFLTKITSTKSRGAMIPIAAEGVTVLQIDVSCTRVGNKEMYSKTESNKAKQIWILPLV